MLSISDLQLLDSNSVLMFNPPRQWPYVDLQPLDTLTVTMFDLNLLDKLSYPSLDSDSVQVSTSIHSDYVVYSEAAMRFTS